MADTLQHNLSRFKDILYNSNPDILKNFPSLSFNRDEFIFTLSDKNISLISSSSNKYSIRVGKENLINMIYNGSSWDILKYDGSSYNEEDIEIIWLKKIIDNFIEMIFNYVNIDYKNNIYNTFLDKIINELI